MNITKEKQAEIWAENQKKGYYFFQPNNAQRIVPRTENQAIQSILRAKSLVKQSF